MKQKRNFAFLRPMLRFGIAVMAAVTLASCSNELVDADLQSGSSENGDLKSPVLHVQTRSGDDATVSYPVSIYVFQGETCHALQTITDADEAIAIPLTVGSYDVYAVGGASADDYTLPAVADATPATAITLKDGCTHGDLMTASATATLTSGGDNSVVLELQRKVLMLQTVTIAQVPASVTAVSVTVSPLGEAIIVAGDYNGTTGSVTVDLECLADGTTWQKEANQYLLPSETAATVTVAITTAEGTRRYSRTLDGGLVANTKYSLSATYQAAAQLSVSLSAVAWAEDQTLSFSFGEKDAEDDNNGGGNNDNPENTDNLPDVGDNYLGCYVLASEVATDEQSAEVTLLSPNETTCLGSEAAVTNVLGSCGVSEVSGWAVPTKAQMQLMEPVLLAADPALASEKFLWRKSNGTLGYRMFGASEDSWSTASEANTYRLRPVAVVTVTK